MTIDIHGDICRCGKRGCIETLASGPAIAARAGRKIATDPDRGEAILKALNGAPLRSEAVVKAWEEGDPLASEVLQEAADSLAVWFGNIADLLEPSIIVVGGGLSGAIERWFERIRSQLPHWSVNSHCRDIPFVRARYGVNAGIVGAAALCFNSQSTTSSSQTTAEPQFPVIASLKKCS